MTTGNAPQQNVAPRPARFSPADFWLVAGFTLLGTVAGLDLISDVLGAGWQQLSGYLMLLLAGWSAITRGGRSYRLLTIALVASTIANIIIYSLYAEYPFYDYSGLFPAAYAIVWGVVELAARRDGAPLRNIHPIVLASAGILLGLFLSSSFAFDSLLLEFEFSIGLLVALPFLCMAVGLFGSRMTLIVTAIFLVAFALLSEIFVRTLEEEGLYFDYDSGYLAWGYSLRVMGESLALLFLGWALSLRASGKQPNLNWITSAVGLAVLTILGLLGRDIEFLGADLQLASFDPAFYGWPMLSFVAILAAGWLYARTGQMIGLAIALAFLAIEALLPIENAMAQAALETTVAGDGGEPAPGFLWLVLLLPVTAVIGEIFARQWRSITVSSEQNAVRNKQMANKYIVESLERKLNGLPMPRPLGDPLMSIARLSKRQLWIGLCMGIVGIIVAFFAGWDPELLEGFVSLITGTLVIILSFSLGLPDRKVNALYLRSFSKDPESELIREHLEIVLGPDFRLSGIRDPHKRMNYLLRPFMMMIMIIKYASARHLGLEAGNDWKARIWASLAETRLVFLDLSEVTEFVKEEVRLSVTTMPLRNIIFIVGSPVDEHEWKKTFCAEYGLAGQEMDQLQLAVWDRNGGSNQNFVEQVRLLVSNAETEPEARLVKSYEQVSDKILTMGELRSEKSKKWIQIVVGTSLAFLALALLDDDIDFFPDAVAEAMFWAIRLTMAAFIFYVITQLVVGIRVKHRKLALVRKFSSGESRRYAINLVKTYALLFFMIATVGFTAFDLIMDV